jgi:hypothetical protein
MSYVSNEPTELVGKTIIRAESTGGGEYMEPTGLTLYFSDGSSVRMEPTGYEVDGIVLELDSYTGRMRRGAIAAGKREARRVERLTAEVHRRRRKAEHDHAKATLTPAEFEAWKRKRDPHYILKQVWGEEIRKTMESQSLLFNRQVFGEQAAIPVFKDEATSEGE